MSSTSTTSSSTSPCAACKFLRRKCQAECVFAPYFPPDQPQKFANVHRVFGASNVAKLLNELHPSQREDAVNSLAFEADMRLRDPVYGCVGVISLLQHQLRQLQFDLSYARSQLSRYQRRGGGVGGGGGGGSEQQQQQQQQQQQNQCDLYSGYQFFPNCYQHHQSGGAGGSNGGGGGRIDHHHQQGGGWGGGYRRMDDR